MTQIENIRKRIEELKTIFIGHAAITQQTTAVDGFNSVLKILDEMEKGQPQLPANLDEAAMEYIRPKLSKDYVEYGERKQMQLTRFDGYDILEAIEFGAEWQKDKDTRDMYKFYYRHFHKLYELGRKEQKQQMLKDAVEGFIFQSADYYPKQLVASYDGELGMGDKVKIVIIPEKED